MTCPYCNAKMKKGVIHSDRYALKWIPEEKDKGTILAPFVKGIKLTNMSRSYITTFYCEHCHKMIFEVETSNV